MITVEKLEKGTYFDDAFKISFRYDPTTVAKVKELAERRYLPEDRAWEIPAHELPALIEKVGLSNIKSEEAVVQALNTKEIEDKREATQERLKGIKPVRDFDFKTAPLPHQIEAFNYGMEKNSLLIGDEQGLGKTKESIDICVARKKELIKTLIVCGVNSVKYNWEKEIQIHSNESCVMVDGKTMDVRVQQLNDWYRGSSYFGVINIESLRNEKIQDALYLGIKDGYIGASDVCGGYRVLRALYNLSRIPERYRYTIALKPENGEDLEAFTVLDNYKNDVLSMVDEGRGLYIWGKSTGNGKTSWACKIMSYFFRKIAFNTGLENEGLYIFLPTFLEDLRDNYDNKDPEFDEILRMIKTCRLLIIDDIGAERVTDWVRERMVSIINTRVSNNLTTIYTSNLSPEELRSELGDRIASRVLGSSQVVEITSGDRRGL